MNKILVTIYVPEIDNTYDVLIPANKKVGELIILINKIVNELSNNEFKISNTNTLWNRNTNKQYDKDYLVEQTDIKNNTKLVLLS